MDGRSDLAEVYRRADLRLRLLLLGDGSESPGLLRGDEFRDRATLELRHMRDAFREACDRSAEVVAAEESAAARLTQLEAELLRIARARAAGPPLPTYDDLVRPAEAARMLGISPSTLYRAIRRGDVRVVRPTGVKRGAIRISRSELDRHLAHDRDESAEATSVDRREDRSPDGEPGDAAVLDEADLGVPALER
jgi:excisionase family DNA binding protein